MEEGPEIFKTTDTVTLPELKRLLHELKDSNAEVDIRFRLLGQMWQPVFYRIFVLTETGAVLFERASNKVEIITNFFDIIQFELDARFQFFQPHNHYTVSLGEY